MLILWNSNNGYYSSLLILVSVIEDLTWQRQLNNNIDFNHFVILAALSCKNKYFYTQKPASISYAAKIIKLFIFSVRSTCITKFAVAHVIEKKKPLVAVVFISQKGNFSACFKSKIVIFVTFLLYFMSLFYLLFFVK